MPENKMPEVEEFRGLQDYLSSSFGLYKDNDSVERLPLRTPLYVQPMAVRRADTGIVPAGVSTGLRCFAAKFFNQSDQAVEELREYAVELLNDPAYEQRLKADWNNMKLILDDKRDFETIRGSHS
jgi:hypothetical protein